MKEYRVVIPEENYQTQEFKQKNLPGVALVNTSLKEFEPKNVFSWHCSVKISLKKIIDTGLASYEELEIIDNFGELLDNKIKGSDKNNPNGLFLAKITWNDTRELIWRVYDPKLAKIQLKRIIERKEYPSKFDFKIEPDVDWKFAMCHLRN